MYLKKIEINGFKSFANASVIEFQPSKNGKHSITAIVGPNGSGKSNVSDAIRWVLGEQSMKQLRGKKSEDIIFAGSDGKGKMSVASVTLVLDNADGRAPIDYDELVISRKIYRTGESEYLLNGNNVRLLDLQILLAQAQFGQGSYSVIGQGTIDRLLLQTPSERKDFFDEAVGIKEFQIKRHHAVLKLNRTRDNMAQAQTLLQEVEPRMKSLRRQVKKLEERYDVEIALRETQEQYYYTLHTDLSTRIKALQQDFDVVHQEYVAVEKELNIVQEELVGLAREKSHHEQFQELQHQYQTLQQEKNKLERGQAQLAGKLQIEFRKAGKDSIAWLEEKKTSVGQHVQELELQLQDRQKKRDQEREKKDYIQKELNTAEREKIELTQHIHTTQKRLQDAEQGSNNVNVEGLRAVNAILNQVSNFFGGRVYGIVAQLAQVGDKFRMALEVAAQSHLTSLIVENDTVAQNCISFLKQQQIGVASFLPLNTIRERMVSQHIQELSHRHGVYGLGSYLLNYDKTFDHIFSYICGNTLIVDDIDIARDIGIGRVRMVTLEGDVVETSGSLKGGFRYKRRNAVSFGQANYDSPESLEKLREECNALQQEREAIQERITELQCQVGHAETSEQVMAEKILLVEEQLHAISRERAQVEQELSMYDMSDEQYGEMMNTLQGEKDTLQTKITDVEKRMSDVELHMTELHNKEEEKRKRVFALQDVMQEKQGELHKLGDKQHTVKLEITKIETHREDLEQELYNELREGIGIILEKWDSSYSTEEVDDAKVKIEKLKYKLSLIGGIETHVMDEYSETKEKYDHLTMQLDDLYKASDDLENMIEQLDNLMKKKHKESFKKIQKEFARYFSILFEGGKAELIEVYGDEKQEEDVEDNEVDVDENESASAKATARRRKILQGIDVRACPPGKKITNIAALSGGERTLTSIALVCAILHTNPSPFVLLDEVEAALDEANTERLTRILTELATQSQFIIITHNRVTMHAADMLYGVTMGRDGISKLVSVELDK